MTLTLIGSARARAIDRINECTNPNFESQQVSPWGGGNLSIVQDGSYVLHWAVGQSSDTTYASISYTLPWQPGVQKWISGTGKSNANAQSGSGIRIITSFRDLQDNQLSSTVSATTYPVTNAGYQGFHDAPTAPAGTDHAVIYFNLPAGGTLASGSWIRFDTFLIMTLPSGDVQYFDGSTGAYDTKTFAWEGAANLSRSIRYATPSISTTITPVQATDIVDVATQSRVIVHQLLSGRTAATLLPAAPRTGVLHLLFTAAADAEAARVALAAPGTWYFTDTDNTADSFALVVTGTVRKYQMPSRVNWILDVPYQELSV